jgi:hypothetical protein
MGALLLQSTAYTRTFLMVQSADHVSALTGATVTVNIAKAGGSFAAPSGGATATEIANGWYKISLSTTDVNTLGDLSFHCTAASGGDPSDFCDQVYAALAANTTQFGGQAVALDGNNYPKVDVVDIAGTAVSATTAQIGANVVNIAGAAVSTATAQIGANVVQFNGQTAQTDGQNLPKVDVEDVGGAALATHAAGMMPADVRDLLGTAWLTPGTAGTPDVNAKLIGATAQTGRDIGASVLLSSGTGTGQVNLSAGTVSLTAGQFVIKKNVALSGVTFLMTDTTGTPKTGLSVTAQRSIDGGALGACVNAVTELSGGLYKIDLGASDLNGTWITFVMTASGAATNAFTVTTQP